MSQTCPALFFEMGEKLWNTWYNWSEREDSNLRPPQPHCGALPGCATLRRAALCGGAVYYLSNADLQVLV